MCCRSCRREPGHLREGAGLIVYCVACGVACVIGAVVVSHAICSKRGGGADCVHRVYCVACAVLQELAEKTMRGVIAAVDGDKAATNHTSMQGVEVRRCATTSIVP